MIDLARMIRQVRLLTGQVIRGTDEDDRDAMVHINQVMIVRNAAKGALRFLAKGLDIDQHNGPLILYHGKGIDS